MRSWARCHTWAAGVPGGCLASVLSAHWGMLRRNFYKRRELKESLLPEKVGFAGGRVSV